METNFSLPNNTKYQVPSLMKQSILSNIICKGLESVKLLHEMFKLKYLYMMSHLLKYYQDQNVQF